MHPDSPHRRGAGRTEPICAVRYHSVTVLPITGLSPGDLLFSEIRDGHAGHVGMYVGNGQVVEEPHPGDHEKIVSLTTYGWQSAGRLHL